LPHAFPSFATVENVFTNPPSMKRIACGPDGNKPNERVAWTRDFFKEMAKYRHPPLDAYDLHFYNWNMKDSGIDELKFDETGWYEVIQGCLELEEIIEEQYALIQEGLAGFPKPEGFFQEAEARCDLVVGEWGNWHAAAFKNRPALYQQCTMRDAITTALTLDIFHRNSELVSMACVAQTVNVLNSLLLTSGENCLRTPNYDVFLMYKVHQGGSVLALEQNYSSEPGEVFAFASKKEDIIYVNLVNTNINADKDIELDFGTEVKCIKVEVIKGDSPAAYNTFEKPDRIRKKEMEAPQGTGPVYSVSLPAASVCLYQFCCR
jgi:alpha-N-arabinofuranosidase